MCGTHPLKFFFIPGALKMTNFFDLAKQSFYIKEHSPNTKPNIIICFWFYCKPSKCTKIGFERGTRKIILYLLSSVLKTLSPNRRFWKRLLLSPLVSHELLDSENRSFSAVYFWISCMKGGMHGPLLAHQCLLRIKKCVLQELGQWPTSPLTFCGYYVFLHPFLTNIFILCFDYFKERCSLNSSRNR